MSSTVELMPFTLPERQACLLPTAGRLVFVVDPAQIGAKPVLAALGTVDGVVVPDAPADLFGRGLQRIFHNYLASFHARYGIAALCDQEHFLLAVRALADEIYSAAFPSAATIVDASGTNAHQAQVIASIYPDALFVVVDRPDAPSPEATALDVPHALALYPADLSDGAALAERLREAVAGVRAAAQPVPAVPTDPRLPGAPIFIVGCPRSGTTWLQNMLDAHPDIGGPAKETAIFSSMRVLLENETLQRWIDRTTLVGLVRRFAEGLFVHCLELEGGGATRFLEKSPHHALYLDFILELFPNASVIGIHRDGRDVVRSLLEIDFGTDSTITAADGWVRATEAVTDFAARGQRIRDEEYEALLRDPVDGVVAILRWLDLPPDASVTDELRTRAGTRVSQHNTTGDVGSGKWRAMPARDLRTTYRIAGDQLLRLGYVSDDDLRAARREPAYVVEAAAAGARAQAKAIARSLRAVRRR